MLLMVLIKDDQVTKIFVNDLNCKNSKNYNSVVSVLCPFPISPQAFRQTLLDMVLFTQITASLHNQRASCMKKSICYFFSPTCCSSAQVHVSRMTHVLLFSTCLVLSWVEQSPLWLQSPVCQRGWERRAAGAPGPAHSCHHTGNYWALLHAMGTCFMLTQDPADTATLPKVTEVSGKYFCLRTCWLIKKWKFRQKWIVFDITFCFVFQINAGEKLIKIF